MSQIHVLIQIMILVVKFVIPMLISHQINVVQISNTLMQVQVHVKIQMILDVHKKMKVKDVKNVQMDFIKFQIIIVQMNVVYMECHILLLIVKQKIQILVLIIVQILIILIIVLNVVMILHYKIIHVVQQVMY